MGLTFHQYKMMKHILLIALNILPLITAEPEHYLIDVDDGETGYSEEVTTEKVYVEEANEKYSKESEGVYAPKKKREKGYTDQGYKKYREKSEEGYAPKKKREKGYKDQDYWSPYSFAIPDSIFH